MDVTEVQRRRNRILELVIETYVSTAWPVGSETVARKLRSSLSPATVRNVMGGLERAGYLEQPHTSAGRVPTDRGYRHYVDSVMDVPRLSAEELRGVEAAIQPTEADVEQLLERAGSALAELTRQAAFAVAPTVKRRAVRQIELVPLSVRKVLCVLIAGDELIASHLVEVEDPISRDEASALVRFVNTELGGLSCADLLESLERRMLSEHDSFYHLVKRCFGILRQALATEPSERFFLEGASYVVSQPEFSKDPRKAHALLRGLDAEEALLERIRQDLPSGGTRVRIGREIHLDGLDGCSYIVAPVAIGEEIVGGLGVLGPKRMDYPRAQSLVNGMGQCVTRVLSRWGIGRRADPGP